MEETILPVETMLFSKFSHSSRSLLKMTMKPLFKKYQIEWSTSRVLYYNIDRKPELQSHFLFLSVLLFFISLFHRTLTLQMLALYAHQIVRQI